MRRDMELIRALLLKFEEMPLEASTVYSIDFGDAMFAIEGYNFDEIVYHLGLILEAGFTEPQNNQGMTSFTYSGLTWRGHDFLDSVRDPKIWLDTKAVLKTAGGFTLDLMMGAAKALVKQKLRELGLDIDV